MPVLLWRCTFFALAASALVAAPARRRSLLRVGSEGAESVAEDVVSEGAEDDDDLAMMASLRAAADRTKKDRKSLEREREKEARKATDAVNNPRAPALAMRDSRVQAAQEPMQELRELYDEGSWGALPLDALLLRRLGPLFAASAFVVNSFVGDFDVKDSSGVGPLLVDMSAGDRIFIPLALGSLPPLVAAWRALARWEYVDSRLEQEVLYFEKTGWADGFMAKKTEDVVLRDANARVAQTQPQIQIL
eukprot:CAMPEP_0119282910 /NCGR_PEP_ID=MMETSP1329-20130426/27520_1 /TAXON_ID=114041 /ORGANISM="Genus nov. species nov., Strain RCC1024" /LENGTH=247 /DNA_ID=CAMNT_0007283575 /DNA_START=166 /DNA_END=905 /DNA_ORIENTATION=-